MKNIRDLNDHEWEIFIGAFLTGMIVSMSLAIIIEIIKPAVNELRLNAVIYQEVK